MSGIYLGTTRIDGGGSASRNIGEIVTSTIPLTDAGLHLLDGALIQGSGSYSAFVDYIADLYDNASTHVSDNVRNIGNVTISDHVASGFSISPNKYLQLYDKFNPASTDTWECVIEFTTGSSLSAYQYLIATGQSSNPHYYGLNFYISNAGAICASIGKGESASNYSQITGSTLSTNTHYKTKLACDGNGTYSLYLKSDSDTDFVLQNSVSGIMMAYSDTYNYKPLIGAEYVITSTSGDNLWYYPFLGSIDLSGCYIKVNDSTWWEGITTVKNGFTTELNWQNSVSAYGVCGKFVYKEAEPNYYAWTKTYDSSIVYTLSAEPSDGDEIYFSSGDGMYDSGWIYTVFEDAPRMYKSGTYYGITRNSEADVAAHSHEVRLPKITGIIEGTTDLSALLDLVEAGLPDHDHSYWIYSYAKTGASGTARNITSGSSNLVTGLASASNPIYGNSTTVQPQTIKVLYYIVISTTTKTDIQVDIDEIATDLNGKADIDLTNCIGSLSASSKHYMATLAYRLDWDNAITVTTTTSNNAAVNYTFPADGMLLVYAYGSGATSNSNYNYADVCSSDRSIFYDGGLFACGSGTSMSYSDESAHYFGIAGEEVTYCVYSAGWSSNRALVQFIPLKKA